jgi:hypothetical protein
VSVVGDSVAHGDAVFEVPGAGYFEAQLAPVSTFLAELYVGHKDKSMKVFNRSASAVGISSSNHPSYFNTPEYAQLLLDDCQYTVIVPWINDLSSGTNPAAAAPNHASALAGLAQSIVKRNARGRILIVNYYYSPTAPFALRTFASGDTPGAVSTFNAQIASACSSGALLLPQVRCVDVGPAFAGMGSSYVLGATSQLDLSLMLAEPVSGDVQNMLSSYFGSGSNKTINGDGVHLTNAGKAALAAYLQGMMP